MPAISTGLLTLLIALAGCNSHPTPKPVGGDLPVASPASVALPGATDAADAPRAPSVIESRNSSLTSWSDPRTGVRFAYPEVWRPAHAGEAVPAPDFTAVAGPPRITQVFLPAGTPYEPTTFASLSFSYAAQAGISAGACAALPAKALQDSVKTGTATYNGVTYSEASGSDAGMCHHLSATIDTTRRGSQCLVFERDFATICPYIRTQTLPRPLTAAEDTALQRHLDAIMASVMIAPAR